MVREQWGVARVEWSVAVIPWKGDTGSKSQTEVRVQQRTRWTRLLFRSPLQSSVVPVRPMRRFCGSARVPESGLPQRESKRARGSHIEEQRVREGIFTGTVGKARVVYNGGGSGGGKGLGGRGNRRGRGGQAEEESEAAKA